MINIVICDDDKSFTANIKKKLKENINFEYNIFSYENYTKEFLSYIKSNKVSTIYILDIDLKNKDTNGLYIARKIRQLRNYSDEIIFFTSYEKYIKYLINSLINPTAYILKSCYDDDNLVNAVNTAYNFIIMRNDPSNNDTGEIAICESKVDYRIKFKEIIYIEKLVFITNIHTKIWACIIKYYTRRNENDIHISENTIVRQMKRLCVHPYLGWELQKLLAIDRIYARNSNIIILDEPSSSLDPISENEIFNSVLNFATDKTIILISHRLANIKNVDKIFFIESGLLLESGSHEELMCINGKYAEMYKIQANNYITHNGGINPAYI